MFKKSMDFGQAGDNIGALLRGVKRDDVIRGQVLAQPNTVKTYKKFEVQTPHVLYIYQHHLGYILRARPISVFLVFVYL